MRTLLSRAAATAACAIGITAALGGTAHAYETVVLPGCWGAEGVVICNVVQERNYDTNLPSVSVTSTQVEVCTGTCEYRSVPFVEVTPNGTPEVDDLCVRYEDRYGNTAREVCAV